MSFDDSITSKRERIVQLHKRLHGNGGSVGGSNGVVKKETQDEVLSETEPRRRIRRNDVRKYLGDPLPLPYLTKNGDANDNKHQKTETKKTTNRRASTDLKEESQIRLKNSLKSLQERTSNGPIRNKKNERIMIDQSIQTDGDYDDDAETSSISQYHHVQTPRSILTNSAISSPIPSLEFNISNHNDQKLIIDEFHKKYQNEQSKTHKQQQQPIKEKAITINLKSILSSPIFFVILILLLYYTFQTKDI